MSDTESKLLARIAALETQLAPSKKNDGPSFDKRKATLDPISYFKEMGLDVQHLSRHFVANALGKDCPPELSAMVQMGPQIAATSHLEELVTSLSRKVEELSNVHRAASIETKTVDQAKYPTLAAAMKNDPALLKRELSTIGDIADHEKAFEKIEEKLKPYASAFGFKPSSDPAKSTSETIQNPDGSTIKSDNKPASALNGEVPPLLTSGSGNGAMTADEHDRLKSAILKKYNLPS